MAALPRMQTNIKRNNGQIHGLRHIRLPLRGPAGPHLPATIPDEGHGGEDRMNPYWKLQQELNLKKIGILEEFVEKLDQLIEKYLS